MQRFMIFICAAVTVVLVLFGCDVKNNQVTENNGDDSYVASNYAATCVQSGGSLDVEIPWVGDHRTPVYDEPRGFKTGTQIWCVVHSNCEGPAYLRTGTVIAEAGPYVVVAPPKHGSWDDPEDLMFTLTVWTKFEGQCLDLFHGGDCYLSEEEAQAIADAENCKE